MWTSIPDWMLGTAVAGALFAGLASAKDQTDQPDARGEVELAKLLSGRVQEKPEHCITNTGDTNPRIIEGTAIVYDFGRILYVNRPRGNLSTLREGNSLVTQLWGSQVCALDRIRTVEPGSGFPHSIMVLGEFVPYVRTARK